MDGHGSTRILTDLAGTILNTAGFAQIYHYTAYGEAINFQMAKAATQYLYSGEQFDSRIGQQYLRARYYDQANGTFNRLDPFSGNLNNPQSFHKYLYTHADPVNATDPTGLLSLGGMMVGMSIGGGLAGGYGAHVTGRDITSSIVLGAVTGALAGAGIFYGVAGLVGLGAGVGAWRNTCQSKRRSCNWIADGWIAIGRVQIHNE